MLSPAMLDFIYREFFGSLWYMPFYFAGIFAFIALTLYARVRGNEQRRREGEDLIDDGSIHLVWAAALLIAPVVVAVVPEVPRLPSTSTLLIGALIGLSLSGITVYLSHRWHPE